MFVLFFLISFFNYCFAKPIKLIDKRSQIVDILFGITGYEGPYTFNVLKSQDKEPLIYKVDYANKSCIVRFNEKFFTPGRMNEIAFHQYAEKEGFGPEVIYSDAQAGIIIMEYLTPSQYDKVSLDRYKQIDLLLSCVKKIHEISTDEFVVRRQQDVFTSIINKRFSYVLKQNKLCGMNLIPLKELLAFFESCIDTNVAPVLVHGDLHRLNIFFYDEKIKLIDFETVRYDHPYVDLAHLAVFFGCDKQEEKYLLEQYWNRQISQHDLFQFAIFKAFVCAKFAFWMLEIADKNSIQAQQNVFYVKPLTEFLNDVFEDKNPEWCYRAGICALKEAEKLLIFLRNAFLN